MYPKFTPTRSPRHSPRAARPLDPGCRLGSMVHTRLPARSQTATRQRLGRYRRRPENREPDQAERVVIPFHALGPHASEFSWQAASGIPMGHPSLSSPGTQHQLASGLTNSHRKRKRKRTTWRWCFDVTGISSTSLCSIPHFPTAPIQSMRVLGRPQGHQAIWRMRDDGLDKKMSYPCHLLSRAPRLREPGSVQDGRRGELLFLACSPGLAWAAWHSTMSIEAISTLQSAAKSMSCDSLGGIPR